MARIEFLINNPTEVEGNDLDLLNQEIEKYPYFYSLRALKLLALKKANNPEYTQYLPITSLFSSNRKGLFQLVNSPEKHSESKTQEIIEEEILIKEEAQEASIESNNIEEQVLVNTAEIEDVKTDIIIEETVSETDIKTDELAEIILEEEVELEDKNALQLYEEIIENLPLTETPSIELVNFAIPNQEEQKNIINSVENSLQVANEILDHSIKVEDALLETQSITEPKIEQVGLINRSSDQKIEVNLQTTEKVLYHTPFFVLNTKDEMKRNSTFVSTETQTEEENSVEILQKTEELRQEIEEISVVEEVNNANNIEIASIQKEVQSTSDKQNVDNNSTTVDQPIEINGSFSFNDWLKLPNIDTVDNSIEIEQKYQIIDEFLEKNPKIKPIKKVELQETYIPKQTDFSDLMTETLAQIYIEQKQYEKAIKAYKILSLKYPEKNSLFAKQIKEIENLKNSK